MCIQLTEYGTQRVLCTLIVCVAIVGAIWLLSYYLLKLVKVVQNDKTIRQANLHVHEKEMKELEWRHKMDWEKMLRGDVNNGAVNKPESNKICAEKAPREAIETKAK